MKLTLITTAAIAALCSAAFASTGHKHAVKHTAKAAALVCPVSGDKIASVKAAVGHSTYKGKTYYFCCPDCKPKFDKNPGKIVANAAKGKFQKM